MADYDTYDDDNKRKPLIPRLVAPPRPVPVNPAIAASLTGNGALPAPASAPSPMPGIPMQGMLDRGFQPVNTPTFPTDQFNQAAQQRQSALQPLVDSRRDVQARRDAARANLDAITGGQGQLPMPEYKQSPFEQNLQHNLEQDIMQTFAKGNTAGDRFNKGWDWGQKIAAGVVAPALGAFNKKLGGPAGVLQGTEMLRQGVTQNEALRLQGRQQLNQAMANLAALYENVSPSSAKNINAVLGQQIKTSQLNDKRVQEAQKRVDEHDKELNAIDAKISEAQRQNAQGDRNDILGQYGAQVQGAKLIQGQNEFTGRELSRQTTEGQRDQEIGLRGQQIQNEQDKTTQAQKDKQKELGQKDQEFQHRALGDLEKSLYKWSTAALRTNASGQPVFRNLSDYFAKNPTQAKIFQQMANDAGHPDLNPDDFFKSFRENPAPQEDNGLADLVNSAGHAAGQFIRNWSGAPQAAATQQTQPAAPAQSRSLVPANPAQPQQRALIPAQSGASGQIDYSAIRLNPVQQQALAKGDQQSVAAPVALQLERMLGRRPSPKEFAQAINSLLEAQHGNQ